MIQRCCKVRVFVGEHRLAVACASGITGWDIETRRPARRDLDAARYGGEVTVTENC